MSVAAGPNIIKNGLVLCLDAGNNKSFKGEPTINLYAYYGFQAIGNGGTHSAVRYIGPAPDLNIPNNYDYFTCTTTSSWAAELNRWLPVMQSAGTPGVLDTNYFTISFYARVTSQQTATIGASFYGNSLRSNGSDINFNLTDKWQRFSIYANAPTIYKNFEFGSRSGAIVFQVAGLQLESKTYATPYVNNTRGNSVDTGGGLFDLTSKGNNGALINGVKYSDLNKGSLVFDGVNDNIQMDSRIDVGNTFTVNVWVMHTVLGSGFPNRRCAVSNSYTYAAGKGFYFVTSGNNGSDFFISLGNDQKLAVSSTGQITVNIPYMLTARVNGSELIKLYRNGIEVSSYATQTNGDIALSYDTGLLTFGTGIGTTVDFFNGSMYNIQIYNRALTPAEVLQNYNATKGRFKLT